MTDTTDPLPHARTFDIPGWPCPPRVRDIPANHESWGALSITSFEGKVEVAQDELGYLWVNGDAVPRFKAPGSPHDRSVTALAFWTEAGIGLWLHPGSLSWLHSVSRLDMPHGQWLPVREVAAEPPAFVKKHE